jgi:hypothetical protein
MDAQLRAMEAEKKKMEQERDAALKKLEELKGNVRSFGTGSLFY